MSQPFAMSIIPHTYRLLVAVLLPPLSRCLKLKIHFLSSKKRFKNLKMDELDKTIKKKTGDFFRFRKCEQVCSSQTENGSTASVLRHELMELPGSHQPVYYRRQCKMRSWTSLALVLRELEVVYSSVTGEIIRRVRKK
ncbi:hypothetical protein V6N11_053583 [Hibiscus sabdariffa]|uniref:Uncharacterized protein n=1 Tax=Hibiscus sabdariffa TaxID=183260 RepID=A0ABR2UDN7_9ROSI